MFLHTFNIRTLQDLAAEIGATEKQIRYLAYSAPYSSKYERFTIPKRSGGRRIIEAPKPSLKYVQGRLLTLLSPYYKPPSCVHGFVEGRSNSTNAKAHMEHDGEGRISGNNRRMRYLVTCDIEDFFGSIDSRRIYGLLSRRPFPFSDEVAFCISKLCTTETGLPQGAPTSPLLSNMVFLSTDKRLMGFAKRYGIMYTRYADDLSFSIQNPTIFNDLFINSGDLSLPEELVNIIEMHNGNRSFSINPRKTRFAGKNNCQAITGIVLNEKPNIKRSCYRELRACLHAWDKYDKRTAASKYFHIEDPSEHQVEMLEECLFGRLTYYEYVTRDNPGRRTPLEKLGSAFNRLAESHRLSVHEPEDALFLLTVFERKREGEIPGFNEGVAFYLDGYGIVTCQHVFKNTDAEYLDSITFELQSYSEEKTAIAKRITTRNHFSGYDCVRFDVSDDELVSELGYVASLQKALKPVTAGDVVYAYRCVRIGGGHNDWKLCQYTVNKILANEGTGTQYFVDNTIFQGMSGGPVLNTRGEVVGLIYSGHDFNSPDRPLSRNSFLGFDYLDEIEANSVF